MITTVFVILGVGLALVIGVKIGRRSERLASILNHATSEFHHIDLSYQLLTPQFICTIYGDNGHRYYGKSGNAIEAIALAMKAAQRGPSPNSTFDELRGDFTPQLS
jgi:hypothetical protein